ncbi:MULTISPECIES: hypothetical protein [Escherichia]|uniref:hypothetical protein n=1 Tax=Escherichia TaxID=561 RepID=UPI00033837DF|nr:MULTISPECIES: hypothetical protein [Escherichia]EGO8474501.1 hypothetical protein [Escherichia coli O143:H4]EET0705546.1 hypothetical protein [Escherichia coli]EEV3676736.1 hypothetical protein [Escherichia coli]EEV9912437.1 hypothetical protein [Escherichia coli]EEW2050287.1 hypothetical protein [Escherichia coli]
MTESELLKVICYAGGVSHQHDEQATQPGSVTAENYARVVAEVMWRDGIELNGQDCLVIRTKVLAILAARRRQGQRQNVASYQWKKPDRLRR